MKTCDVNPYIRLAIRSEFKHPYHIKPRIILDYELIHIESGTLLLEYNGTHYHCKDGDILLLRPGILHAFYCTDSDLSQPHIHFDVCYNATSSMVPICFQPMEELPESTRALLRTDIFAAFSKNPILSISDKTRFLSLFYSIIDEPPSSPNSLATKSKFILLLDQLVSENYPGAFEAMRTDRPIYSELKALLDNQLCTPVCLDTLASQFNYSKFYLSRQFKKHYGQSIIQYHQQLRLTYAKQLLSSMTVSQVCDYLHYSSIFSFSRAFKNYFHVSPSQLSVKK